MNSIQAIRESEKQSHTEMYSNSKLFEEGSWLSKPIRTVLGLIPFFQDYKELNVLDLGCGVGRNCIAIAEYYKAVPCRIDCVDILEIAIEKLQENAANYGVTSAINGIVSTIEAFEIQKDKYDLVLAISALEHTESKEIFTQKLAEIKDGIKSNGIVCLVVNSQVIETDRATGKALFPQFEVNLQTEEMLSMLNRTFAGWEIIKRSTGIQQYDIPRGKIISALKSNVITFVARKATLSQTG